MDVAEHEPVRGSMSGTMNAANATGGEVPMSEPQGTGRRFFISYRRRAQDDARLAKLLVDELRAAGHDVFIDVDIPIGTDWSAEITRRIQWCDYLVVLLSEDSFDSEMVQGEIRLAHHYRRDDGSPYIFPIRIRYEGALDYELTSYIGRLQHILWKDAADGPTVVRTILEAARNRT
ncbi:MAG: toll/interleukin-1 receptor domain-containing protein, partial [Candidatus Methylophosphatis roskildensis]